MSTPVQALLVAWYNFGRKHEALKGTTPAMAAQLTDHVWTIKELIAKAAEVSPMGKQLHFSIRSLLFATAWMSVFFASITLGLGINDYSRSWDGGTRALAASVLMLLIWVSPSFAVGHLTDRPVVAISCGLAIVVVTAAVVSLIPSLQK